MKSIVELIAKEFIEGSEGKSWFWKFRKILNFISDYFIKHQEHKHIYVFKSLYFFYSIYEDPRKLQMKEIYYELAKDNPLNYFHLVKSTFFVEMSKFKEAKALEVWYNKIKDYALKPEDSFLEFEKGLLMRLMEKIISLKRSNKLSETDVI